MNYLSFRPRSASILSLAIGFAVLAGPVPALAQSDSDEARLRRLEAEVRALQREVFPGGDGRFFTPEIAPPDQASPQVGTPSTGVLTDVLARLDSIETQLARLTARAEEGENRLDLVEERLGPAQQPTGAIELPPVTGENEPVRATTPVTQPEPAAPSPERLAAVQAIAKPQSGDAGDDEYVYGFRLYDAGFFPEARQQLRKFVDNYPGHWRLSYGRNLLGRAYLEDKSPREAASWFLQNYQADKQGVRAADSLLYLAQAMIDMGDTNRACIALTEFGENYPALASGRLASQYESNRARVDCD